MKQHLIVEISYALQGAVNKFLRDGWRVVPGTMGMASLRYAANVYTECDDQTPAGEAFKAMGWCVVEREVDDRAQPATN